MKEEDLKEHSDHLILNISRLISNTRNSLLGITSHRLAKKTLEDLVSMIPSYISRYIRNQSVSDKDKDELFNHVASRLLEEKLSRYIDSRQRLARNSAMRVGCLSFEMTVVKIMLGLQSQDVRVSFATEQLEKTVHDSEMFEFLLSQLPSKDCRRISALVNINDIIKEISRYNYHVCHPLHASQIFQTLIRVLPHEDFLAILLTNIGDDMVPCWNFIMQSNSLSLKAAAVEGLLKHYQASDDIPCEGIYTETEGLAKKLQDIYTSPTRYRTIPFCLHVLRTYTGRKNNNKSSFAGTVVTLFHNHKEPAKELYEEIAKVNRRFSPRPRTEIYINALGTIKTLLIRALDLNMTSAGNKAGCYTAALLACLVEIEHSLSTKMYLQNTSVPMLLT